MMVVFQYRLQYFKLPVIDNAVRSAQTDVKEPESFVDLLSLFPDATHVDSVLRKSFDINLLLQVLILLSSNSTMHNKIML